MAFKKFEPRESYPREMVEGNWQCAGCGAEINQLPFKPLADKPVFCKDCWTKRRNEKSGEGYAREMVQGNWQCAGCGAEINQLPFKPLPDKPVYCKDCWIKRKT